MPSKILDKIEQFIFDILGLFIPGLFAILAFGGLFDFGLLKDPKSLLALTNGLKTYTKILPPELNGFLLILLLFFVGYFLGHLIKVLSKIFYGLMEKIFDNFLIYYLEKFIKYMAKPVDRVIERLAPYVGTDFLHRLIKILEDIFLNIRGIFTFSVSAHGKNFTTMKTRSIELINRYYGADLLNDRDWHPIFKFATVVLSNNNLKSFKEVYLAKYNFYRSLSFLFITCVIFMIYAYTVSKPLFSLTPYVESHYPFILVMLFLVYAAFHDKYKRYWALCGNEVLVTLFYYLEKCNKENKQF